MKSHAARVLQTDILGQKLHFFHLGVSPGQESSNSQDCGPGIVELELLDGVLVEVRRLKTIIRGTGHLTGESHNLTPSKPGGVNP